MSNGLERIIDLQISRETAAVSQAGFGAGNFLSNDAAFSERIKQYSSLQAVSEDDLAGADTLAFATVYFGQSVRPTTLYVTKKGKDLVRIQTLDFVEDFVTGNTIDLKINGVSITQVPFDTNQATTLAALNSQIQSNADVSSASVTGSRQITITGDDIDTAVVVSEIVVAGGASQTTGSVTVTQYEDEVLTNVASLQEAQQSNNDWYALAAYERTAADILLLAAFIQAQRKIYGVAVDDSDVLTAVDTDIASQLKANSYDRTFIIYSADQAKYPEGAALGGQLPKQPGSITWKFKTLSGVAVDNLTDTEIANALSKNCNIYTTVGGQNMMEEGKMAQGEFIDIIRGVDWMDARITENIFQAFISEDKIPYTNNGASIIVNRIKQILDQAVTRTILSNDPEPSVFAPLVSDVPTNDRANRILPDVTFEGVLAGAIHKTIIRGTVSV